MAEYVSKLVLTKSQVASLIGLSEDAKVIFMKTEHEPDYLQVVIETSHMVSKLPVTTFNRDNGAESPIVTMQELEDKGMRNVW